MKAGYKIINYGIEEFSKCICVANGHVTNTVHNIPTFDAIRHFSFEIGVWKIKQLK